MQIQTFSNRYWHIYSGLFLHWLLLKPHFVINTIWSTINVYSIVFIDPQNICFAIKIKSLCDIGAKLWAKIWFSHVCWRPSWIFVNTFFPKVCQLGTLLIYDLYTIMTHKQQWNIVLVSMQGQVKFHQTISWWIVDWLVWSILTDKSSLRIISDAWH